MADVLHRRSNFAKLNRQVRKLARAWEETGDEVRIASDALVRHNRSELEYPDLVLGDEEREAISARQMGRTLADIDDLPTAQ